MNTFRNENGDLLSQTHRDADGTYDKFAFGISGTYPYDFAIASDVMSI